MTLKSTAVVSGAGATAAIAFLLVFGCAPRLAFAIEPGQLAPDFELPGRQGVVRLSDYRGKAVYLDFWASWCGPCKKSFPWMNDMQARYGARGLRVIGLNVDQKPADAAAFLEQIAARFDIAFDPKGASPKAYGVKGMPTSILIGPDGRVLAVHSGFRDEQRDELETRIKAALPQTR